MRPSPSLRRLNSGEVGPAIREAHEGDEAFILALNAASTPEVGEMDAHRFAALEASAAHVLVAEVGGVRCAFAMLFRPKAAYDSDNYAWFEQRFARHLYIDRVAVEAVARGQGVGQALYRAILRLAEENGDERLTAEVNVEPPNPGSLRFHEAFGFRSLETRASRAGKLVAMLERPLSDA